MKTVLWLLAGLVLLSGCDQLPFGGSGAYPPPDARGSSAYPAPGAAGSPGRLATRTLVPKPGAGVGVITGRLVQASTGAPLTGVAVYLGDITPLTPGPDYLITIQQNSSAHTTIDEDGYFALTDVQPGTYGLIVWTPIRSAVVPDPAKPEKEILVTVKPGEITDTGELKMEWQ